MSDEEKAIACTMYYQRGKVARKSPVRVHRTRAVACDEAEEAKPGAEAGGNARVSSDVAGPSQPWSAQSPAGVKATNQVSY